MGKASIQLLWSHQLQDVSFKRKFKKKQSNPDSKLELLRNLASNLVVTFDKTKNKTNCGDKDCLVCKNSSKKNTKCRIPNVVYKISCLECQKQNVKACYYGETCFNAYTRGGQHQTNYRSKNKKVQEDSAMRRHAKECHDDKKVDYRMEVLKTFRNNPLARQVYESIQLINSKSEDNIQLNSKKEFNQALIVTAKFSMGVHTNTDS